MKNMLKKALTILASLFLCVFMSMDVRTLKVQARQDVFIESIAVADAVREKKAKKTLTDAGYTVIDYDLNKDAGGQYVYMGYKTTKDPSKAITGVTFYVNDNDRPDDGPIYRRAEEFGKPVDNVQYNLLGTDAEPNHCGDGIVDLNNGARGRYIYTYVTRDSRMRPFIEGIYFDDKNYIDGVNWTVVANYRRSEINLNAGTGDQEIYMHCPYFTDSASSSFYYIDWYNNRCNRSTDVMYVFPNQQVSKEPEYKGREAMWYGETMEFVGYREDDIPARGIYPAFYSFVEPKVFRGVYFGNVKVNFLPNGGDGSIEPLTEEHYINAGSVDIVAQKHTFTIPSQTMTHPTKCKQLGWSTDANATTASYTAGSKITVDRTTNLYAIYDNTHISDADDCNPYTPVMCIKCGSVLQKAIPTYVTMEKPEQINGVYQIENASDLWWFSDIVNNDDKSANAVLTADIDMKDISWTAICETGLYYKKYGDDDGYTGIFDGNGHTISNLTVKSSTAIDASAGLFGTVSGTIKNLGMKNFTFESGGKDVRVGAIVGQLIKKGKVSNCYVDGAKIQTGDRVAGGVAGCVYEGTVENCYVVNSKITGARYGYVTGDARADGNKSDRPGYVKNCYTDEDILTSNYAVAEKITANRTGVNKEVFNSGEICWHLNAETGEGNLIWGQSLTKDPYPVFRTLNNTVCSCVEDIYYNHTYVEGVCQYCKSYQMPEAEENGVYQISTPYEFLGFAYAVNNGFNDIDAVLIADIDMTGMKWTQMNSYTGIFDGDGYTITGLCKNAGINDGEKHGFIRTLEKSGVVKNLTFKNADIFNHEGSGAISAVIVYTNNGTVENCMVTESNIQHGKYDAIGAVVGVNTGTIRNCASVSNTMTRRHSALKAVCGFVWSNKSGGIIENCINYDCKYENGTEHYAFTGINNGTIINSYYYASETLSDKVAESKTKEAFASGEVAYLLNGSSSENVTWYQKLLTDTYPVLDSEHGIVYSVFKCDGTTPAGYSNENENIHTDKDNDGYCDLCDVIYNGIGAHLAGYSVSLNGCIGVNFHMDLTQDVLNDN
ncbi:MAG: hypothetical protein E7505_04175, partial [Ruminococcus sp.]|nr:hypothetical protein [Ruminococcus sp.]